MTNKQTTMMANYVPRLEQIFMAKGSPPQDQDPPQAYLDQMYQLLLNCEDKRFGQCQQDYELEPGLRAFLDWVDQESIAWFNHPKGKLVWQKAMEDQTLLVVAVWQTRISS
jgi:hypothetical protein